MKMTDGVGEMRSAECGVWNAVRGITLAAGVYVCICAIIVLLSGCATIAEFTGEAERAREEKQELENTVSLLELEKSQLETDIQQLKLEVKKRRERESALSTEVRSLRQEKGELEEKLLSSRQHQKKLETQLAESDRRLSKLIEKKRGKWVVLDKIKGELSSGLRRFGGWSLEERGDAVVVILKDAVTLKSGKVKIRESSFPLVLELAKLFNKRPGCEFIIEGHTDDIPTKRTYPSNWELSTARALSILHYLEGQGIAPERMSAIGRGEYMPRASNATAEGRKKNRRVEILIVKRK